MAWGVRGQGDEIQPARKPEPVDLIKDAEANMHPALQDLHRAVEVARAGELPGVPTAMTDTLSVLNYEPPEDAIQSALGS